MQILIHSVEKAINKRDDESGLFQLRIVELDGWDEQNYRFWKMRSMFWTINVKGKELDVDDRWNIEEETVHEIKRMPSLEVWRSQLDAVIFVLYNLGYRYP